MLEVIEHGLDHRGDLELVAGHLGGLDQSVAQAVAGGRGEEEQAVGELGHEGGRLGDVVEEVGAQGEDEPERRGGVVAHAGEARGEGVPLARVGDLGVELLELIDEQQDVVAAAARAVAQRRAEVAGLVVEALDDLLLLRQIGRSGDAGAGVGVDAAGGGARAGAQHRRERVGEGGHRAAAGADDGGGPLLPGGLERGDDTCAHERGLADAGRTDDAEEGQVAQPGDGGGDLALAAEEAVGVGLLERLEAGVGALVGAQPADVAAGEQRLERVEQLARGADAVLLVLEQAAVDDVGELVGEVGADDAHAGHRLAQHAGDHQVPALAGSERVLAGDHLEQDDADGP